MSYNIEFKLKKKNNNLILFFIIKEKNLFYYSKKKLEIINKYIDIITKNEQLYLCFDARSIKWIDLKLLWEGASDLAKHNDLFIKKIKATSVILDNPIIKNTVDTITKVTPFATPTKFVSCNNDALNFLEDYMNR